MSGRPRCASIAPSRSRTSACTIDCGCTTTSMRSNGTSNSQCASITSRPLFISVAESIVMRAPIVQVGCRSACSGVTASSSAGVQPRNGPPLAVTTSASTAPGSSPASSCCSAECSESTGSRRAPPRASAARTSGPPATRLSLLASATSMPASSATSVASRPAAPTTALSTTSAPLSAASCATPAGPDSTCPGSANAPSRAAPGSASAIVRTPSRSASRSTPSTSLPAASAQTRRPGSSSQTWIACRPIEPVLPRSAMSRITRRVGQLRLADVTPCRAARRSRARPARRRAARRCGRARRRGPPAASPSP